MTDVKEVTISNVVTDQAPATTDRELLMQQTQALTVLAQGVNSLAEFVVNGGLGQMLSGYARTQSVQGILNGLAAHGGRAALDARFLKQNALEITEAIEQVFDKYKQRTAETAAEPRDPHIKEPAE